jgi:hypothetical protein
MKVTAVRAFVSLHWAISAPTNNDQRQFFGRQFVFTSTLADLVCFVCHASLAFSMASAYSYDSIAAWFGFIDARCGTVETMACIAFAAK